MRILSGKDHSMQELVDKLAAAVTYFRRPSMACLICMQDTFYSICISKEKQSANTSCVCLSLHHCRRK